MLAPFLFIIVIDFIVNRSAGTFGFEYRLQKGSRQPAERLNDLDYADDFGLLERFSSLANDQLRALSQEASKVGLQINLEKTEYMVFNQPPSETTDIYLNGSTLKQVTDFKYLGSKMETDFMLRKCLACVAFWNMEKQWRVKHVPTRLKIAIFIASALSIMLYGSEKSIVSKLMEEKFKSFATRCYRIMREYAD